MSKTQSPWIDESDLHKHGALIVWKIHDSNVGIPQAIHEKFPAIGGVVIKTFAQSCKTVPPIKLGVTFLAPTV